MTGKSLAMFGIFYESLSRVQRRFRARSSSSRVDDSPVSIPVGHNLRKRIIRSLIFEFFLAFYLLLCVEVEASLFPRLAPPCVLRLPPSTRVLTISLNCFARGSRQHRRPLLFCCFRDKHIDAEHSRSHDFFRHCRTRTMPCPASPAHRKPATAWLAAGQQGGSARLKVGTVTELGRRVAHRPVGQRRVKQCTPQPVQPVDRPAFSPNLRGVIPLRRAVGVAHVAANQVAFQLKLLVRLACSRRSGISLNTQSFVSPAEHAPLALPAFSIGAACRRRRCCATRRPLPLH